MIDKIIEILKGRISPQYLTEQLIPASDKNINEIAAEINAAFKKRLREELTEEFIDEYLKPDKVKGENNDPKIPIMDGLMITGDIQPYRCPICGGTGQVPNGFYDQTNGNWSTSSTIPELCRSCNGTGIVWSK